MQREHRLNPSVIPSAARMMGYFPVATCGLIVLNIVTFIGLLPGNPQDTASWYGVIPEQMQFPSLFTSLFIHFEPSHLLVNLLFLWLFGRKVEKAIGPLEFILFYIGSGFLASVLHVGVVMTFLHSQQEMPLVGASGAVSGIIGMYAIRFRGEKTYIAGKEVPTVALFLAWFMVQVSLGVAGLNRPQLGRLDLRYVGYWSHVGGFVFGMTAAWLTGLPKRRRYEKAKRSADLRGRTLLEISQKYELLAETDTEDPFIVAELGRVRAMLLDQAGSVDYYLKAVELYKQQAMDAEALLCLHETLRFWPEVTLSHDVLFRIGCYFESLGEPHEAASRFAWLATTAHGNNEGQIAMLKLGQIELDRLHHPDRAIQSLRKLLEEHPDSRWADAARQLLERAQNGSEGSVPGLT